MSMSVNCNSFNSDQTLLQVIRPKSGNTILTVDQQQGVVFKDKRFERRYHRFGVRIPPQHRAQFGGREAVRYDENDFLLAFVSLGLPQLVRSGYKVNYSQLLLRLRRRS